MKKIFSLLLSLFLLSNISAQSHRIKGSPYPVTASPNQLFLTSESWPYSQILALQSLQGIIAKTKPEILRDMYGHKLLATNNGITLNNSYYNNFQGLLTHFAPRLDGYILCDAKQNSTNVALSLSGIMNAVAIPADIESIAVNAGLKLLLDVRGKDETWLYLNYGTKFNKTIASYQNVSDNRGLFLGDYSAFAGAMQFWSTSPVSTLSNSIFNTLKGENAVVLGWGPGEDNTVAALSKKSLMIHAADFAPNLSTLTNIDVEKFVQKDPVLPFKVVPDVHTVCFVMSDGDNIQWLLGSSDDANLWANPNRSKVNLGWTISPAMTELAPPTYKKYVDNCLTSAEGRNVLIAAPSGRGYFNPGIFPNLAKEGILLNKYMKKGDLRIANMIDVDNSPRLLEPFLKHDNIDALFYYNYSDYSGLNGSITWYKDKPSIGGRFNLWYGNLGQATDKNPETLALELNNASTNIHSSAGYSLIPVIVWARNVNDVMSCIGKLNPNIRVVAPDEFVWLIRKNIKGLALGNGKGLKATYYQGGQLDSIISTVIDRTIDILPEDENTTIVKMMQHGDWSSIWEGQIQPVYSGKYTFFATVSQGARLTINNTVLIDQPENIQLQTFQDTISLEAGKKYDLRFENLHASDSATVHLEWESISQMRQTIPQIQLYSELPRAEKSTGVITAYADCDYTGFFGGLKVGQFTTEDLNVFGIYPKDIASIRISKGYKVTLFENDFFSGDSLVLTSDSSCLNSWSDKTSSIRITTNGITNLEGTYFLKSGAVNLYMEVAGGYTNDADAANLQLATLNKYTNQQFKLIHLGDGTYKIQLVHSNKSIDVATSSLTDGTKIQQMNYYGLFSQQFIITSAGADSYYLTAKHSGKLLEASNIFSGAGIRQWTNTGQIKGKWKFVPVPELSTGTGNGLTGRYYNGINFDAHRLTKIDTTINFNWASTAPNSAVGIDNFSIRWTGQIEPRVTGNYTFFVNSDNGRRLTINDQIVIDKWIEDYNVEYTGSIFMAEGNKYDIQLDYFETIGGASCKMEWESAMQPRQVVPKSQLYSMMSDVKNIEETDLQIYPIPVTNKTLHIKLNAAKGNLILSNLMGEQLLIRNLSSDESISLNQIPPGTYLITIVLDGKIINKKIFVL